MAEFRRDSPSQYDGIEYTGLPESPKTALPQYFHVLPDSECWMQMLRFSIFVCGCPPAGWWSAVHPSTVIMGGSTGGVF